MLNLKKIAVTGAIASGKSSVCQAFKKLGAYVVDSDKLVHQLLDAHTSLGKKIIDLFGPEIVEEGRINRKRIAQKAFHNLEALRALENLIHPSVLNAIVKEYEDVKDADYTNFVVEIPLLFETGTEQFYDVIILVSAKEFICKERLQKLGIDKEEYERRMARQLEFSTKKEKAHFLLENNGSLQELEKKVEKLNLQIQTIKSR
jgi:dephospho-CoA kinase